MHSKLLNTFFCLALSLLTMPVFSHSGHTSLAHSHSGLEWLLLAIVIAAFIYHKIKN